MSKIYARFSDPAFAEKAAGALLDYGVRADDISLIRSGNEDDFRNWEASRAQSTYGTVSTQVPDPGIGMMGAEPAATQNSASGMYAPEAIRPDAVVDANADRIHGQFLDRSDPEYIYENSPSDAEMNDPHYRAAERASNSDYVEERSEMDAPSDTEDNFEEAAKKGISTTTPADAGAGAAKGAGWGLGLGILAAVASIFVPGFGLVAGGGALAVAIGGILASTGAGAIAGAVTGYLKDQGMDEHLIASYNEALTTGGAILEISVPSGDVDEATAREVLAKYGAANIGVFAGASRQGYVS